MDDVRWSGRGWERRVNVYAVVVVLGHPYQQIGHQPGMVANPARGQLNRENAFSLVPVRA